MNVLKLNSYKRTGRFRFNEFNIRFVRRDLKNNSCSYIDLYGGAKKLNTKFRIKRKISLRYKSGIAYKNTLEDSQLWRNC